MNLVKLIEQTVTENQIPPIQKDAKYFQNLDYRLAIHGYKPRGIEPRLRINWKTGKPFTPEEIAAAELPPLTSEELAELEAHDMERARQQEAARKHAERQRTIPLGRDPH